MMEDLSHSTLNPFCLSYKEVVILLFILLSITVADDLTSVNEENIKQGREKYETIKREARMPKYGPCWTNAIHHLENGCKQLTDDTQHRLALSFANCFLEKTGRVTYTCDHTTDFALCTKDMTPEAYNTYTEFFTHTQNMCHFLRAQVWQAETDNTIHKLADNSETVAKQLDDSSKLQNEVIEKQNQSLKNQEIFLQRGSELKQILEDSTVNVHNMLTEFKETTLEQKDLIFEVFERVDVLQSLVMGEFTGFYSLIFYSVSVIICYLLTSTPRTSGARFWLFVIMTVNIAAERIVVAIGVQRQIDDDGNLIDEASLVYNRLWICRKAFTAMAILMWAWAAYRFKDLNQINNQLLVEIRKQNSDLKRLMQDSPATGSKLAIASSSGPSPLSQNHISGLIQRKIQQIDHNISGGGGDGHYTVERRANGSSTGYGTGSTDNYTTDDTDSDDSAESDRTFLPADHQSDSEAESEASFWTSRNDSSRESTPALLDELNDLRQATPLREMTPIRGLTIADTSLNSSRLSDISGVSGGSPRRGRPRGSTTRRSVPLQVFARYNLRSRRGPAPVQENPVVRTESVGDFRKMIRQMSEVTERNRARIEASIGRTAFFSSDED